MTNISFGDNVRIISTNLTKDLGMAGKVGSILGETIPSVTGVNVIGDASKDHAFNVAFKNSNEHLWFSPELLEFIDHGEGTEITIEGVPKKWIRSSTGEWQEILSSADDHPRKK